jgi:hypothetical protein
MHAPLLLESQKSVWLPDWEALNESGSTVVQLGI